MAETTKPSEYEPRRPSRSATTSTDRLRNLYTTGDESGTWTFRSEPLALAGSTAFVRGWADYVDGEPRHYHNLWVIEFADDGRASSFTEWFMKQR